jgi:hypothetical protein
VPDQDAAGAPQRGQASSPSSANGCQTPRSWKDVPLPAVALAALGAARLVVTGVVALHAAREEGRPFADLAEAVAAEYLRLRGMPSYGWPDGDGLVARLGALCPAATVALVDAGERALTLRGSDGPKYRAGGERWLLRAVGLVRE